MLLILRDKFLIFVLLPFNFCHSNACVDWSFLSDDDEWNELLA